jgi:hypothetical protein
MPKINKKSKPKRGGIAVEIQKEDQCSKGA